MKPIAVAYLHIGFEKTGSTSLYNTLEASRGVLAAHGVLFPNIDKVHATLPLAFGHDTVSRRRRLGLAKQEAPTALAKETLESLERQVASFAGSTVVLSSESLAGLPHPPLERLRDLLASYAETVKVVAYVRHPIAQAVSFGQQVIKSGASTRLEIDAQPRRRPYEPRLRTHIDVFGRANVIVRVSDPRRLFGGRVQPDFFQTVGCGSVSDAVVSVDSNPSLSMPAVILADLMNQHAGERRAVGRFIYRVPGRKFSLSDRAIQLAAEDGEEDIRFLREEFGIEFEPPSTEPRLPLESYFTDDVMAALDAIPSQVRLPRKAKLGFYAALNAIRDGAFDAPRPVDDAAAIRRVRAERTSRAADGERKARVKDTLPDEGEPRLPSVITRIARP